MRLNNCTVPLRWREHPRGALGLRAESFNRKIAISTEQSEYMVVIVCMPCMESIKIAALQISRKTVIVNVGSILSNGNNYIPNYHHIKPFGIIFFLLYEIFIAISMNSSCNLGYRRDRRIRALRTSMIHFRCRKHHC